MSSCPATRTLPSSSPRVLEEAGGGVAGAGGLHMMITSWSPEVRTPATAGNQTRTLRNPFLTCQHVMYNVYYTVSAFIV